MIVVMPNGSLPRPANMPARRLPASPVARVPGRDGEAMQNRFTNELLKDVVPAVEKTYRVQAGPENRALAGLSMGGGQTLRVLDHATRTEFAYVGVWSAGIFGGNAAEWEKQNETFLAAADKVERRDQACSRSASATRTSPWPARSALPRSSRSAGSSTSCESPAAATPGSTGGTTSTNSRRSCSGNGHGFVQWPSRRRISSRSDHGRFEFPLPPPGPSAAGQPCQVFRDGPDDPESRNAMRH